MPKKVPDWWRCKNCKWWLLEKTHCHRSPQTVAKEGDDYCAGFTDIRNIEQDKK